MLFVAGITAVVSTTHATGPEAPITVSPGNRTTLALVEARCPTFSWGAVAGAEAYELVVYELGNPDEEAQAVLREAFHGSVSAWTPSLERCLKRGARYAWSVRTDRTLEPGRWSEPSLFQVAAAPREMELAEALRVVRAHLADRPQEAPANPEQRTSEQGRPTSRESRPPSSHAVSSVPKSATVSPTLLSVSGNVNAESFSGDGSELTNLSESDPLYTDSPAAAIVAPDIASWDTAFAWGDHGLGGYLTAETDPSFSASPASGITTENVSSWNTAFVWGNHASAGYLTSETDPIFSASPAATITSGDIADWDLAFSQGDHASAGYLMSVQTTTVPDDATPSVEGTTILVVSGYTVATDIVDLDDGVDGQCVVLVAGLSTVNPVFKSKGQGGSFRLFRDSDSLVLEHNTLTVCRSSGTWFEISRQTNRP